MSCNRGEDFTQQEVQKACFYVIFPFSFPLLEAISLSLSAFVVIIPINFHPCTYSLYS